MDRSGSFAKRQAPAANRPFRNRRRERPYTAKLEYFSMSMRTVVITGLGSVSALGLGVDPLWKGLTDGRSGIGAIALVPPEKLDVRVGAEVPDYRAEDHFELKQLGLLDRFSQFALLAAREAVEDAGLAFSEHVRRRTGVIIGTGVGGEDNRR